MFGIDENGFYHSLTKKEYESIEAYKRRKKILQAAHDEYLSGLYSKVLNEHWLKWMGKVEQEDRDAAV